MVYEWKCGTKRCCESFPAHPITLLLSRTLSTSFTYASCLSVPKLHNSFSVELVWTATTSYCRPFFQKIKVSLLLQGPRALTCPIGLCQRSDSTSSGLLVFRKFGIPPYQYAITFLFAAGVRALHVGSER